MAFQSFMKIDGVSGESVDEGHESWIELLGVWWELTSLKDPGRPDIASRTRFSDFTISKFVDLSSPLLLQHACSHQKIPEIKIEVCRAGGSEKMKYMEFVFTNCVITKVQFAGMASEAGDSLPSEEVAFNYEKFKVTYMQQKRADGLPEGVTHAIFDLSAKS